MGVQNYPKRKISYQLDFCKIFDGFIFFLSPYWFLVISFLEYLSFAVLITPSAQSEQKVLCYNGQNRRS